MEIKTTMLETGIAIITENADGSLYMLSAEPITAILNEWKDGCGSVPANDAPVYFATWNNKPIDPFSYTDFKSLHVYFIFDGI